MPAMAISSAAVSLGSSSRPASSYTKVAVRDGKTISINDHIYLSSPWMPGGGEPYIIGRVMEFVTASSSRSGAALLASSSGTLQVRVNVFQRQRDISLKPSSDSRLLVATMHTELFSLENVRGLCEVRHRELIGDAPQVSAWKKKDDHFYYFGLYDRYIHRHYDVIPTAKLRNAPPEVLETLRKRYSFIIAETGMTADLCDAVRGCTVCHQWASGTESVRCDTCKKSFHMRCLNPPLAAKPAKGYSWTCAPCSKRHEQTVAMEHGSGSIEELSSTSSTPLEGDAGSLHVAADALASSSGIKPRTAASLRGGRPRGSNSRRLAGDTASAAATPQGSPAPEKTIDDVRGVRCYERWPYRYFGQHTVAMDVLDPHDSIYPRATTRLGQKFQVNLVTWEQQKEIGLGVALGVDSDNITAEEAPATLAKKTRQKGKKGAAKKDDKGLLSVSTPSGTPTIGHVALPDLDGGPASARDSATPAPVAPVREFERGGDESVEAICDVSAATPDAVREERTNFLDAYMASAAFHFKPHPSYNVDFINHAVKIYNDKEYQPVLALQEVSKSSSDDLRIVHWTQRERKAFEQGIKDYGSEMRHLKRLIPTKKVADIVRYFAMWKNERLKEQHAAERAAAAKTSGKDKSKGGSSGSGSPAHPPTNTRAVSPALSEWDDTAVKAAPNVSCKVCGTTSSSRWYRGAYVWPNRFLCINCGSYWRKYAAEPVNTELISTNPRKHALNAEEAAAAVAPPAKVPRTSKAATAGGSENGRSTPTTATAASSTADAAAAVAAAARALALTPPQPVRPDPIRCVLCRRLEPKKRLQQCLHCSLSVHQGCFGLTDEETASDKWICDTCSNEQTLDNALNPACILCPSPIRPSWSTAQSSSASGAVVSSRGVGRGRQSASSNGRGLQSEAAQPEPLNALDAVKPTECNNWAHMICAAWIPEVMVTDPIALKPVEGAGNLPFWRYAAVCEICEVAKGACIQCSEPSCKSTFHVSCAFTGSTGALRFEINPVKMSRRDAVTTASFKSETGHWTCLAFCKAHKDLMKEKPLTYDFFETDPKTGLSALQTYMRTHKSIMPVSSGVANGHGGGHGGDQTHALLRRAKRYDAILNDLQQESSRPSSGRGQSTKTPPAPPSIGGSGKVFTKTPSPSASSKPGATSSPPKGGKLQNGSTPSAPVKKQCIRCSITFSPFWWPVDEGRQVDRIHRGADEVAGETVTAAAGSVCCNLCRPVVGVPVS